MGTYKVPMELHAHNRNKLLTSLRHHLDSLKRPLSGFVLLQGGEEQHHYCTDTIVLFRQESYFAYLFGVKEPGFFGAVDIKTFQAYLFIPRLPPEYAIWSGEIHSPSYFKDLYKVDAVFYVDEMQSVLNEGMKGAKGSMLYLLHGLNTDSNNYSKPAHFEGIDMFETNCDTLHPILTECRVIKSHYELNLLRYVNKISSAAHVEGVLDAQKAVIATIKPGVSWIEMHKLAESIILEALVKANILRGSIQEMLEKRIGAIFMPHGLGHFLGLDTHDPGGYLKGAKRPADKGLESLRTTRTLEEGMVITVEPGCYFIDILIDQALEDPGTSSFINREEIARFRGFGGVRLEDDVVVTADGCENLTSCPHEISDVEAVMAGKPWPPKE